jgi:hypothetical protein
MASRVAGCLLVLMLVAGLIALDLLVRAARRSGGLWPSVDALEAVRRERWTTRRLVAVFTALLSFYATYLAYRNLKSVVPLVRPGELFDSDLARLDRAMFAGPRSRGALPLRARNGLRHAGARRRVHGLLRLHPDHAGGRARVLAQPPGRPLLRHGPVAELGARGGELLPAAGPRPRLREPSAFANLAPTGVARLQEILLDQRLEFLANPAAGGAQSIAAFASLHVSIFFTGVLAAHLLGLGRRLRIAAWVLLAFTTAATIHLGWHYVVDVPGGLVIGFVAVAIAKVLTGFDPRAARRASTPNLRLRDPTGAPGPRAARVARRGGRAAGGRRDADHRAGRDGRVGLTVRDPRPRRRALPRPGRARGGRHGRGRRGDPGDGGRQLPAVARGAGRVRRERWTRGHAIAAGIALISFYVTYMAYRNLKGVLPLVRPDELFDRELADADRWLFLGATPWSSCTACRGRTC